MDIVFMVDTGHDNQEALDNQKRMLQNLTTWIPRTNRATNFHQQKLFAFNKETTKVPGFTQKYATLKRKIDRITLNPGKTIPIDKLTDKSLDLFSMAFSGGRKENKKVVILLHSGIGSVDEKSALAESFWSEEKKPEDIPFVISVTPEEFSPSQLLRISENHCFVFQPTSWQKLNTVTNMIKQRLCEISASEEQYPGLTPPPAAKKSDLFENQKRNAPTSSKFWSIMTIQTEEPQFKSSKTSKNSSQKRLKTSTTEELGMLWRDTR
ncbi:Oidioi.mRNA.OKI2018_I69.chr2.g5035.t1.cds [Oikopleura dioica]|uniref:Oidioi.mRNA.OKI2018_I69.chr2.g5035.t1.cds n=1 Tax=Oikopleura dioica TaxID=34765 RepID=A0ABN7T4U0_OIKDI|nr:Oidioi.mRNA.OKI2018_I69.chr2.g5035.t1.cds [Oikopleura dioica]